MSTKSRRNEENGIVCQAPNNQSFGSWAPSRTASRPANGSAEATALLTGWRQVLASLALQRHAIALFSHDATSYKRSHQHRILLRLTPSLHWTAYFTSSSDRSKPHRDSLQRVHPCLDPFGSLLRYSQLNRSQTNDQPLNHRDPKTTIPP